jgi:hypothetical protein
VHPHDPGHPPPRGDGTGQGVLTCSDVDEPLPEAQVDLREVIGLDLGHAISFVADIPA